MFSVAGYVHQTTRAMMLDFEAGVIRHQMTDDDEGFGTSDDVLATAGGPGLSATGTFSV